MTQYISLNVKLSNLYKEIKSGAEVTLKLSSNVIGDSSGESNFPRNFSK